MTELSYEGSQHDILADFYNNNAVQQIDRNNKIFKESIAANLKEANLLAKDLETQLDRLKMEHKRYQKCYFEWQEARVKYLKMETNQNIPRNEIAKQKNASENLDVCCENLKSVYASQLMSTNKYQQEYYHRLLPEVLNALQNIEIERVEGFKDALSTCLKEEKSITPILNKCRKDMEEALWQVNPSSDSYLWIDR